MIHALHRKIVKKKILETLRELKYKAKCNRCNNKVFCRFQRRLLKRDIFYKRGTIWAKLWKGRLEWEKTERNLSDYAHILCVFLKTGRQRGRKGWMESENINNPVERYLNQA